MRRGAPQSRIVLGILLAASLALIVLDSRAGANPLTSGARSVAEMAFFPVSAGISAAARPVDDTYQALKAAPGANERVDKLERRNKKLTAKLHDRDRDAKRSTKLEKLLHLSGRGGYEIVPAQAVVRMTSRGDTDIATLDVGTRDGVHKDMTVVNGDGLVGRVSRAGASTSTVLLVTDGSSVVGARLEGSGEIGMAEGTAHAIDETASLRFELMDAEERVKKGQRVVTLGSHESEPFVPGVPVGKVASVSNNPGTASGSAEVDPAVDISSLDVVGVVVKPPKEDPRDSVLPSGPEQTTAKKGEGDNAGDSDRSERGEESQ